MKKVILGIIFGILIVGLVGVLAEDYVEGEILVGFNEGINETEATDLIISKNLIVKADQTYSDALRFLSVIVPAGEEQTWIDVFETEDIVDYAQLNLLYYTTVCDSDNLDLCLDETNCTDAGGYWYNDVCNEEEQEPEDNETTKNKTKTNQGLGQIIRGRVKAGVYTSPTGEQIRVRELAQNRFLLSVGGVDADCDCELEKETEGNKTKLKVKLSNGRNAEIKIMPDVASERALERLRLKVCSEENNCTIVLKEVALKRRTKNETEEIGLAYEMQVQRHARILWLFKKKMRVQSQVDAETGEIIKVKKPWWAFLASEPEE